MESVVGAQRLDHRLLSLVHTALFGLQVTQSLAAYKAFDLAILS